MAAKINLPVLRRDSISTMSARLQDAVLVGIGLLQEDVVASNATRELLRPVLWGRAIVFSKASIVVSAAVKNKNVAFFCSCGSDSLDENVGANVRMGDSSTCHHAVAYSLALLAVAKYLMLASVTALLSRHPVLNTPEPAQVMSPPYACKKRPMVGASMPSASIESGALWSHHLGMRAALVPSASTCRAARVTRSVCTRVQCWLH